MSKIFFKITIIVFAAFCVGPQALKSIRTRAGAHRIRHRKHPLKRNFGHDNRPGENRVGSGVDCLGDLLGGTGGLPNDRPAEMSSSQGGLIIGPLTDLIGGGAEHDHVLAGERLLREPGASLSAWKLKVPIGNYRPNAPQRTAVQQDDGEESGNGSSEGSSEGSPELRPVAATREGMFPIDVNNDRMFPVADPAVGPVVDELFPLVDSPEGEAPVLDLPVAEMIGAMPEELRLDLIFPDQWEQVLWCDNPELCQNPTFKNEKGVFCINGGQLFAHEIFQ